MYLFRERAVHIDQSPGSDLIAAVKFFRENDLSRGSRKSSAYPALAMNEIVLCVAVMLRRMALVSEHNLKSSSDRCRQRGSRGSLQIDVGAQFDRLKTTIKISNGIIDCVNSLLGFRQKRARKGISYRSSLPECRVKRELSATEAHLRIEVPYLNGSSVRVEVHDHLGVIFRADLHSMAHIYFKLNRSARVQLVDALSGRY